jgi:hypothetical protein
MFWEISKELKKQLVVSQHIAITFLSLEQDPGLKGTIPKMGKGRMML